jgi:hypothetical protein
VSITVNAPPVAVNDSYTVQENSSNNSLAVLANDSDPDGDPLTITNTSTPGHGTATINGSSVLYTPTAGYFGPDSFSYTISDGQGGTASASVSITVNAPPVAVNDSYTVQENSSNNSLAVLANDSDPDGDPLTITNASTPGHGMTTINGSNVLYTPTAGYFGPDSFTYTISDGQGGTASASVSITVNAPPVAVNDSYTVQENSSNNSLAVLANDSDPDGDPLTITNTSTPGHGTATINGSNVLYTPTAGYFGPDSFSYTISDGQGGVSTASVSITVAFRPVTISGTVFQDLNDNHVQDSGESGLSGWTVQLDGGAMTAVTNASGNYTFTGVGPGSHTISEVVQSAYIETSPRGDTYTINTSNGLDVSGENFSNEVPTNARDNSRPGYSENGSGWTTLNSGWLGNSRTHTIDTSGKTSASWSLNVGSTIPAGNYEVFVSYVPAAGRATNAPYTIADNKTILATVAVDQTATPNDGLYQGVWWRSLGVFTFNSGKPIVTLSANANGVIDADGVLLIPASAYAPPLSPLFVAASPSPQNPAAVTSAPVAGARPLPGTIDHIFSDPHIRSQGVWLGGAVHTTPAAIIDAALAGLFHPADQFNALDPLWLLDVGQLQASSA